MEESARDLGGKSFVFECGWVCAMYGSPLECAYGAVCVCVHVCARVCGGGARVWRRCVCVYIYVCGEGGVCGGVYAHACVAMNMFVCFCVCVSDRE
jgi:hypothetical protein